MALKKKIRQSDGVITTYHRILYTQSMINSHVSIAVVSYVDEEGRNMEKRYESPYKVAVTYETDYVENMTIEMAYNYLKTLDQFKDAEDVLESDKNSTE